MLTCWTTVESSTPELRASWQPMKAGFVRWPERAPTSGCHRRPATLVSAGSSRPRFGRRPESDGSRLCRGASSRKRGSDPGDVASDLDRRSLLRAGEPSSGGRQLEKVLDTLISVIVLYNSTFDTGGNPK